MARLRVCQWRLLFGAIVALLLAGCATDGGGESGAVALTDSEMSALRVAAERRIASAIEASDRCGSTVEGLVEWASRPSDLLWIDKGARSGVREGEVGVVIDVNGQERHVVVRCVCMDSALCQKGDGVGIQRVGDRVVIGKPRLPGGRPGGQ